MWIHSSETMRGLLIRNNDNSRWFSLIMSWFVSCFLQLNLSFFFYTKWKGRMNLTQKQCIEHNERRKKNYSEMTETRINVDSTFRLPTPNRTKHTGQAWQKKVVSTWRILVCVSIVFNLSYWAEVVLLSIHNGFRSNITQIFKFVFDLLNNNNLQLAYVCVFSFHRKTFRCDWKIIQQKEREKKRYTHGITLHINYENYAGRHLT